MSDLTEFLLARIAEDEAVARSCAEMFPTPWDISDRGWRVRIYASEVPEIGDHAEPGWVRHPVVMEVEPDRHIQDPKWLSERVEHVQRHDPARVLAECEAKRETLGLLLADTNDAGNAVRRGWAWDVLRRHAAIHADHPDYREEWRP